MSLPLFFGLSAALIGGTVLLLHLLGLSKRAALTEEKARRLFLTDYPDADIKAVNLSAAESDAVLELSEAGHIGVLQNMGAFWAARALGAGDIEAVTRPAPDTLRITLDDFTDPAITLQLGDELAARWEEKLGRLLGAPSRVSPQTSPKAAI